MKLFLALFGVCLFCHAFRTLYEITKQGGQRSSRLKLLTILMYPNMVLLWVSWFQMCEIDPVPLSIPAWIRFSGLVLFLAGLVLFIVPLIQMRGVENTDRLITTGIFRKLRHPMYLGFIFWIIGYSLFNDAKLVFFTSIIWIANIMIWRHLEERQLLREYGEYVEYKAQTWF